MLPTRIVSIRIRVIVQPMLEVIHIGNMLTSVRGQKDSQLSNFQSYVHGNHIYH